MPLIHINPFKVLSWDHCFTLFIPFIYTIFLNLQAEESQIYYMLNLFIASDVHVPCGTGAYHGWVTYFCKHFT